MPYNKTEKRKPKASSDRSYGRWSREDFKRLAFDPFILTVTSKNFLDKYPKLIERDIFVDPEPLDYGADKNKVICYLMLMYQLDSPLLSVDSVMQRKIEAARLAQFDITEDGLDFMDEYKQVIFGNDKRANRMMFEFCRMQNNDDFTELMVYMELFHDQLNIAHDKSRDTDTVKKAVANVTELKGKIKDLKKTLLFDDQNEGLMREVMEQIDMERIELRREDIARKMLEGGNPLEGFNPYGKSYKFKRNPDINREQWEKAHADEE